MIASEGSSVDFSSSDIEGSEEGAGFEPSLCGGIAVGEVVNAACNLGRNRLGERMYGELRMVVKGRRTIGKQYGSRRHGCVMTLKVEDGLIFEHKVMSTEI